MNLFDWFLIAILAYSTIMAFLRGIILELFSLGGLIAGILLASWNYNHVAVLSGSASSPHPRPPRSSPFSSSSSESWCSAPSSARALNRTAHAIGLGFFDRLLGAIFGFRQGLPLRGRHPDGRRRLSAAFRLDCKFPLISLFPCGGSCGILRCTSRSSAADSEWRRATQAQRARLDQTAPVEAQ